MSIETPGLKCMNELLTVQLMSITLSSTAFLRVASDGEATVSRVSAVLVLLKGEYEIVIRWCANSEKRLRKERWQ